MIISKYYQYFQFHGENKYIIAVSLLKNVFLEKRYNKNAKIENNK